MARRPASTHRHVRPRRPGGVRATPCRARSARRRRGCQGSRQPVGVPRQVDGRRIGEVAARAPGERQQRSSQEQVDQRDPDRDDAAHRQQRQAATGGRVRRVVVGRQADERCDAGGVRSRVAVPAGEWADRGAQPGSRVVADERAEGRGQQAVRDVDRGDVDRQPEVAIDGGGDQRATTPCVSSRSRSREEAPSREDRGVVGVAAVDERVGRAVVGAGPAVARSRRRRRAR